MERVQIYLGRPELDLLDDVGARTGATRSELIRRAVRDRYGGAGPEDRRAALRASAGGWQSRAYGGASYVAALRGDLNRRLPG
jgi:Ribbon-helix-helix protein, copG family